MPYFTASLIIIFKDVISVIGVLGYMYFYVQELIDVLKDDDVLYIWEL